MWCVRTSQLGRPGFLFIDQGPRSLLPLWRFPTHKYGWLLSPDSSFVRNNIYGVAWVVFFSAFIRAIRSPRHGLHHHSPCAGFFPPFAARTDSGVLCGMSLVEICGHMWWGWRGIGSQLSPYVEDPPTQASNSHPLSPLVVILFAVISTRLRSELFYVRRGFPTVHL